VYGMGVAEARVGSEQGSESADPDPCSDPVDSDPLFERHRETAVMNLD